MSDSKNMKMRRTKLAQAILILLSAPSAAWTATDTVAVYGAATPISGRTYSGLFAGPVLNDFGEVAFTAWTRDAGFNFKDAIFSGKPDDLRTIVLQGDNVPEGNGLFGSPAQPKLNNLGQVAFTADLTGTSGGTNDDSGVYLYNGFSLNRIARENQTLPEGNGQFSTFYDSRIHLNDAGQASFWAGIKNFSGASYFDEGLYRGNGITLSKVERAGDYPPGRSYQYLYFSGYDMNSAGQLSFASALACCSSSGQGIYTSNGNSRYAVVEHGNTAADSNGQYKFDINLPSPQVNDFGQIVFASQLSGSAKGTADDSGIFIYQGTDKKAIAREGSPIYQGVGKFADLGPNTIAGKPLLSESGVVAFKAELTDTVLSTSDDSGLFSWFELTDDKGVKTAYSFTVARENDLSPGNNGRFAAFGDMAVNNTSNLAFTADLRGTSGGTADDRGLFISDVFGSEKLEVIREGAALADSTVSSFEVSDDFVNDMGQVAYQASLTNGKTGVFLYTPELHLKSTASTLWEDAYWTLGLTPGAVHDVVFAPETNLLLTGPNASRAEVKSLEIGGAQGTATFWLNQGTLASTGGVNVRDSGILTGNGVIEGRLINQGTVVADAVTVKGTFYNEGVIKGNDQISGGAVNGKGQIRADVFSNEATGQIRANSNETIVFSGNENRNEGSIQVIGGEVEFKAKLASTGEITGRDATLRFDDGLDNSGTMAFSFGTSDVFGDVKNLAGSKIINSGSGNLTFYDDVVHNGSEIRTSAGAQTVFLGNVSGAGSFKGKGTVAFEGGYLPGNSPAWVTSESDLDYSNARFIEMEIAGRKRGSIFDPVSEYDAIDTDGILTLGGTLKFSLLNGFVPLDGDLFTLFLASSIEGSFTEVLFPQVANLHFDLIQEAKAIRLMATTSAVPLPPSFWVFASGLLSFRAFGRCKKMA